MSNNIEIIDVDDNNKNLEGNTMTVKKKKRHLKKGIIQTFFCLISLIFIIGCFIFYGSRLVKYYKIYNPKSSSGEAIQLITNAITQKTEIVLEGSGMYRENGVYVFKGEASNNYIKFANMMWRIVRTNADGSLEIILDDAINALAWDVNTKEYIKSDIHKYLNDIVLSKFDTNYLVKTSICTDLMESIDKFSCDNKNLDSYAKLLEANDFLNSVIDGKTYIVNDGDLIWLSTSSSSKVWHTNGSNISSSDGSSIYLVKPVVTIKNSVPLLGGTGTKEDPYIIEENTKELKFGSYVKLGDDTWVVYDKNDNIVKLAYSSLYGNGLKTYRFSTSGNKFDVNSDNSLAKLLNTTFYDALPYKDMLLEMDIYTGGYKTTYKDTFSDKTKAKVGLLNITDIKFDSSIIGYYLSNSFESDKVYYYRADLISSKVGLSRPYRPVISIKAPKVSKGNGTLEDPFVIEVANEKEEK